MSWVDELTIQYRDGRKGIRKKLNELKNTHEDQGDREILTSMLNEMTFVIDWLDSGKNPNEERGIHKNSIYQITSFEEMDLLPDIYQDFREEREELAITEEQRQIVINVLASLSDRERQCYIRHEGQRKSFQEIAEELNISKSSVQGFMSRARKKVKDYMESIHKLSEGVG